MEKGNIDKNSKERFYVLDAIISNAKEMGYNTIAGLLEKYKSTAMESSKILRIVNLPGSELGIEHDTTSYISLGSLPRNAKVPESLMDSFYEAIDYTLNRFLTTDADGMTIATYDNLINEARTTGDTRIFNSIKNTIISATKSKSEFSAMHITILKTTMRALELNGMCTKDDKAIMEKEFYSNLLRKSDIEGL